MFKTLKQKLIAVYLLLVFITAAIGITSVLNIYYLNKSIDGLMVDNYKSISAVDYMMESIQEQNNAVLTYIHINPQRGIEFFHKNSDIFYKWYNIEANNITEPKESEYVERINKKYIEYLNLFSQVQEINRTKGEMEATEFYNNNISPVFNQVKLELRNLTMLNEKAMFSSKDEIKKDAEVSMYAMLLLSFLLVIGGSIMARVSINKFLKPIYILNNTVQAVEEGELGRQTPVTTEDEIGQLTKEFNRMTKKLYEFEQSTTGKLLTEKNRFETVVKSISDPIIVLDTNYKILLLNNALENLFDIEEKNVIDKYFLEVIRNNELYDYIYNVYENPQGMHESKIFHINFKEEYYFNIVVTILKDIKNRMIGMIVLFQNVTQLKQLEKIKSDFISTISHEFKTPLTSIIMGASLINNESIGELNGKQKEIIDTIVEDSERLSSLVTNLLQLSKIESNRSIFNIESTSIIGIVENSVKSFIDQAVSKDIELIYELEDTLPKIRADQEKITWVINNLITNALKYTNAGDTISINAFVEEGRMFISVKDTGIGIPYEYLDKIFGKFVQIKGSDSESKGTGLGLAIAKEIVEAHGGEIWCESKLDVGSTFTFTLSIVEQ